jgi:heme-degrading monooxygenase HmoA
MPNDLLVCPVDASSPRSLSEVSPVAPVPGFVAVSKFVIANDLTADVKDAFRNRPHLVDDAPGYLRMDVISPLEQPDELWLITFWTDQASFEAWHHSHHYQGVHTGIPKGLKLVPRETQIRTFAYVAS